jgi:peptidoglycan/xylan/chitin deacetylase (PgdA/CDA1 family)
LNYIFRLFRIGKTSAFCYFADLKNSQNIIGRRMIRSGFNILSKGKKLSILIYHQVLADFDPMRPCEVTAEQFETEVVRLKTYFNILTLRDAMQKLHHGTLPKNPAVITFDDGYENNASVALPILKKHQVTATFFIASDFLNGGAMWNDKVIELVRAWPKSTLSVEDIPDESFDTSSMSAKRFSAEQLLLKLKYLPLEQRTSAVAKLEKSVALTGLMMSDAQVLELHSAGMEIGGHTCSHPILATLKDEEAFKQIKDNKVYLERLLGEPIESFAYPNGKPNKDYSAATKQQVLKAGYKYAVSTCSGVTDKYTDAYQIPRFTPWRKDKHGFLGLMAKNYFAKPAYAE